MRWTFKAILYLVALPMYIIMIVPRTKQYIKRLKLSVKPYMECPSCGAQVPLVGMWKCPCGYQYQGHLLKACANCGRTPLMARCWDCGVTIMLR